MIRLCDILSRSNMEVRSNGQDTIFGVCVHCDLDLGVITLGQCRDIPLGHGQQFYQISISNLAVRRNGRDTRFWVCVHSDLALGNITLGKGHDTPLNHGQQWCEISRSNLALGSNGQDTDFRYACTVTLTFEILPWAKVMTHPWVMDNNCVKYYQDQTWQ